MKIAIVGPGAIGSTFALHLAKAGHAVTVIARAQRLAYLQRERSIVMVDGERVSVEVAAALDVTVPYDLVLVALRAHQVDAVLPAVSASAAAAVMFMFNTFEPLDHLRDSVGAARFSFGFPAIVATLTDGALERRVFKIPQITIVTDARWAKVFSDAGIATKVKTDMHSWLRTHAAVIVPFMVLSNVAHARGAGVTLREALTYARGMSEGFDVVRGLGNTITPRAINVVDYLPSPVVASLFWALSRMKIVQQMGAQGAAESRVLIDAMTAAAPSRTPTLRAMRP
jgi:2-dehydropantoate 2-reductase